MRDLDAGILDSSRDTGSAPRGSRSSLRAPRQVELCFIIHYQLCSLMKNEEWTQRVSVPCY